MDRAQRADARFRRLVRERSLGSLAPPARTERRRLRVLVHGVSVGEVKAARALVAALADECEIVLSSTTDAGMEQARVLYPSLACVRFPLDASFALRRFLARVEPDLVLLVELELWPNFLRACNRRGIPLAVVNGRLTERSFPRYRRLERVLPQFARLSLVCAQDEEHASRFRALGVDDARLVVTGNVKTDGLRLGARETPPELCAQLGARPGQPVLVAGSTHAPEERWVLEAWRAAVPQARLILVPRHVERARALVEELAACGARPQRLSELRAGEAPDPSRPALVDTIGELESVYSLADLVFVGGSLTPRGGQNMLEPAAQAKAVVHGALVPNFAQEAALLARAGASRVVDEASELAGVFRELVGDPQLRARMGQAGMRALAAQSGANDRTLGALRQGCLDPLARRRH